MAGLATVETDRSVENFISNIGNESKEADSRVILKLMEEATGWKAKVWGNEKAPDFLIGFGKYSYQRKGSKEEFEWFRVGFAPRKSKLTIYLTLDVSQETELLKQLGKCTWGKGCLYLNNLKNINLEALKELIAKSANSQWH